METINKNCYVYKWTHIPTLKWYVGVRFAKGCYPNDGYICSSKIVKPLIKSNPEEWKREIISTGTKEAMTDLEKDILHLVDAINDSRSFNNHNGTGKPTFRKPGFLVSEETKKKISNTLKNKNFNHSDDAKRKIGIASKNRIRKPMSEEAKKKMSEVWKFKIRKPHSDESKKKMSEAAKRRKPMSEETKEKLKQINLGKKLSEETKNKMKGRIPWNKGIKE